MPINADKVLIVFKGNVAAKVGAESTGLIVIFRGPYKEGGIVNNRAEILHDFVVNFNSNAYLNTSLRHFNIIVFGFKLGI